MKIKLPFIDEKITQNLTYKILLILILLIIMTIVIYKFTFYVDSLKYEKSKCLKQDRINKFMEEFKNTIVTEGFDDLTLNEINPNINEVWQKDTLSFSFNNSGVFNKKYGVLDENNAPVKNGESGELTFTTIGVEAMPLIRFKTGDIVQLYSNSCSCGRNTFRLGPVIGRKQHMIKYKGTTLYPPVMNDVLNDVDNIESYIIEISTNDLGTDEILIKIAVKEQSEVFLQELKDHFRAKLRVTPKIEFSTVEILNPLVFNKMSRKPIRFFDKRTSDY